jgi:hypothetical protein
MSTIIPDQPLITIPELVRLTNCPQCWQRPGKPCSILTGPAADHLARWQRAEERALIGREALAAAVASLEVIAPHVLIWDGSR